jgi:hypothetical protein
MRRQIRLVLLVCAYISAQIPTHTQVVLQRRSGHQYSALKSIMHVSFGAYFSHTLKEFSFLVTKAMRFVDDGNAKWYLTNDIKITDQCVICCDENVELQKLSSVWSVFEIPLVLSQDISPDPLTVVIDTANHISPALELAPPVLDRRQGNDNKKRTSNLFHPKDVFNIANNLDRLAQTLW